VSPRPRTNITPFSSSEGHEHEKYRADRNLLVHGGGIISQRHEKAGRTLPSAAKSRVYFDYLAVTPDIYAARSDFILRIATKLIDSTTKTLHGALEKQSVRLSPDASRELPRFGE
jgi:hypothetical protein